MTRSSGGGANPYQIEDLHLQFLTDLARRTGGLIFPRSTSFMRLYCQVTNIETSGIFLTPRDGFDDPLGHKYRPLDQ